MPHKWAPIDNKPIKIKTNLVMLKIRNLEKLSSFFKTEKIKVL